MGTKNVTGMLGKESFDSNTFFLQMDKKYLGLLNAFTIKIST